MEKDKLQTAFIVPLPPKAHGEELFDMLQEKLTGIEVALIHIEEIMERSARV